MSCVTSCVSVWYMWSWASIMPKEKTPTYLAQTSHISTDLSKNFIKFVQALPQVTILTKKDSVKRSATLQPCVGICWPPHATGHHTILYTIHHTNQNHPAAHKTKLKGHENQPGASQDFHCEAYEMKFASAVDASSSFVRCMEVWCK